MLLWMVLLFCVPMTEAQELFQKPVLSTYISADTNDLILKCSVTVDSKKPGIQLFYSLYKDSDIIQDMSYNPVFYIEAKDENMGLYQCMVETEDSKIQKRSEYVNTQFWTPVSRPVLTLHHQPTDLAVGDKVEIQCEVHQGSLPISYSFYIDGEILGIPTPSPVRSSIFFSSVKAEWSAKNYSCEANNYISRKRSETKKFPLVVSGTAWTKSNMLSIWLPASLVVGWSLLLRF